MNNVTGWVCPKCGFVWSSMVPGCWNCNKTKNNVDIKKNEEYLRDRKELSKYFNKILGSAADE